MKIFHLFGFVTLNIFLSVFLSQKIYAEELTGSSALAKEVSGSTYQAESGILGGSATIVGVANRSDRSVGDLGGEASGRQAVTLTKANDSVSFVVRPQDEGANAIVIRYSIPDAPNGGGLTGSLDLLIKTKNGAELYYNTLTLTSRYAWLYGGTMYGTKLFNVPQNALNITPVPQGGPSDSPTHLYDEIQLEFNKDFYRTAPLRAGDIITLQKTASSQVTTITIDFMELEFVVPPLPKPRQFLSLTDPICGAISFDVNNTGEVFDGKDDSSYGSVFHSVTGFNPATSTQGSAINEKDYYSTDPKEDALQDTTPNKTVRSNLSMFALAENNLESLNKCIAEVTKSKSPYAGIWVPPGRYYVRGKVILPSNVTIQGAGMWHTKFVAVDTATPQTVTLNVVTGIQGTSGNLVFFTLVDPVTKQFTVSDNVHLSGFSMFGNITQRDVVDAVTPIAIHGGFSNSSFDHIWVEHYLIGINIISNSSLVTISHSRVRNTFADGIDLWGSTAYSTITYAQARSTGDDGFALWSQGLYNQVKNNKITNSVSQLQWWGDGFAIYGGVNNMLSSSIASDTLNYPCVQASTNFIYGNYFPYHPDAPLAPMSATISDMILARCGGNGFNEHFGALQTATSDEDINSIKFKNIRISGPTYEGIDIRTFADQLTHKTNSNVPNVVSFDNINVLGNVLGGSPTCGSVSSTASGSAQMANVCYCASLMSAPGACNLNNESPNFKISGTANPPCEQESCSSVW